MIECVILEDEKPAQQVLKRYINQTPFLALIGTYESGVQIPSTLLQQADLLFLDVQLPEMSGLSFLKSLSHPPKVIVTTAYSDYAIAAFEEAVVDYLLKPFSYERFFKAVDRVRNMMVEKQPNPIEQVFVYADKAFHNIKVADILYIKAEVDYVNIITTENSFLILDSLRQWGEKLGSNRIIQCHRSYLVNLDQVVKVFDKHIHFADGRSIPIGETFKPQLFQSIKA